MSNMVLFCLPYAGGSSTVLYTLSKKISCCTELVDFSGKGTRIGQDLYDSFDSMVDDIVSIIVEQIKDDKRYALLGYSMGSLVAYEVAKKIQTTGYKSPDYIFLAASSAPHVYRDDQKIHTFSDRELVVAMSKMGGMSEDLLSEPELVELFVPPLRRDLEMLYEYNHRATQTDIEVCSRYVVMYSEVEESEGDIHKWSDFFSQKGAYYKFDGGHFFVHDPKHEDRMASIINQIISDPEKK